MDELTETLFGWRVENAPPFKTFYLSKEQVDTCISAMHRFFTVSTRKNLEFKTILQQACESKFEPISTNVFSKMLSTCTSLLKSVGPVDVLLSQDVEEISLSQGRARVFQTGKGWVDTKLEITSEKFLLHVLNKLASNCGRRLTVENPILNAFLEDGTRIHAVAPPLSPRLTISIRKFRAIPFTLNELVQLNLLSGNAAVFLEKSVSNTSILIAGNTGSGKTTTLNAILSLLPRTDRFVFIEDVSELSLPSHSHKARLLTHGSSSLAQLTYESLRMRPDRLIVSEVRSEEEVKAFANALLSGGGKTCYSTFHASSADEALRRLELLKFRKADLDSLGLVVVQKRFDDENGKEKRRVTEISRVAKGKPVPLFKYSEESDCLEKV